MRRRLLHSAGIAALCYASTAPGAAFFNVGLAVNQLYLIVGPVGAPTTPGAVTVTMTVPAAQIGDPLTPVFGSPHVQIQMGIRRAGGPQITATLTATAPAALMSGGNQIPIDQIGWTSVDLVPACFSTIASKAPPGGFIAGPQIVDTLFINVNGTRWSCGDLTFSFANSGTYPAGTYTGTVTFTASRT